MEPSFREFHDTPSLFDPFYLLHCRGAACDACRHPLGGGRVVCLDCPETSYSATIDLCADPRCYLAEAIRDDLVKPHLPSHDILKARSDIQWHEITKLKETGRDVLRQWRLKPSLLDEATGVDDNGKTGLSSPFREDSLTEQSSRCFACREVLSQPYWYCTQCAGEFSIL